MIVGCAKSGTTLLRRLFHAFDGVEVIPTELSLDQLAAHKTDAPVVVGKRIWNTAFSTELSHGNLYAQLAFAQTHGIEFIYIERDRASVVRPGLDSQRWDACRQQATAYGDLIAHTVLYERLLVAPNYIQEKLAERFELTSTHVWSDYPRFIPDGLIAREGLTDEPRYHLRPIGAS